MGLTTWWRKWTGKKTDPTTQDGEQAGRPARPRASRPEGRPQPSGRPGRRPALDPSLPVLGVEATKSGWLGAVLEPSGHGTPHLVTAGSLEDLLAEAGQVGVVAVGVPLGLPDDSRREADGSIRQHLGPQSASVLTTPVRAAVYAATHGEANALNREHVGSGVSTQAWELRRRIQELDAWVRQDLPAVVVETHAETAFTELVGHPLTSRRRSSDGAEERRAALSTGGVFMPTTVPHGAATEDVLDACAAAWSAHRVKTGQARSFPQTPQTFSDGIPSAIQV